MRVLHVSSLGQEEVSSFMRVMNATCASCVCSARLLRCEVHSVRVCAYVLHGPHLGQEEVSSFMRVMSATCAS